MANWKHTLEIKDEWQATKAGEMTIAQFATVAAEKIKALPVFGADGQIEDIVENLELLAADADPDVEEFDGIWNELYNWADQVVGDWNDKMCWIRTF